MKAKILCTTCQRDFLFAYLYGHVNIYKKGTKKWEQKSSTMRNLPGEADSKL